MCPMVSFSLFTKETSSFRILNHILCILSGNPCKQPADVLSKTVNLSLTPFCGPYLFASQKSLTVPSIHAYKTTSLKELSAQYLVQNIVTTLVNKYKFQWTVQQILAVYRSVPLVIWSKTLMVLLFVIQYPKLKSSSQTWLTSTILQFLLVWI